jgi:hypothetical protein
MNKDINNSFSKKIYECNKHIEKIKDSKEYLEKIIPLSLEQYLATDKIDSSFIDQLIFRFSKLQDTIGESILKGILILSKEDVKKMTFIDILNRMEELEVLDKNDWLKLREVRNEIAHEYSFNQNEVVDNINLVYLKSNNLIEIYNQILEFIDKKKLLNNE